jgi:hypothetical protein
VDRGERFPIVFSHVSPDAAFKAPSDAYYVQAREKEEERGEGRASLYKTVLLI